MGMIGILLSIVIVAVGAGYIYFGKPNMPIVVENQGAETPVDTKSVTGAQELIGQANDLKTQLEDQAKEKALEGEGSTNSQKSVPASPVSPPVRAPANTQKDTKGIDITNRLVDFGFSVPSKPRTIDTVVLHSSYDPEGNDPYSVSAVIKIWKSYGVAPHYMIDREGKIYRLVEDKNIAFHAGVSEMPDGRTNVNDFSLGVEILNAKDDKYTDAEYKAVNDLIAYLKEKYSIKSVVGHDDIAPGRKTDPWNFDWKKVK